jgi:hypothetical protein
MSVLGREILSYKICFLCRPAKIFGPITVFLEASLWRSTGIFPSEKLF